MFRAIELNVFCRLLFWFKLVWVGQAMSDSSAQSSTPSSVQPPTPSSAAPSTPSPSTSSAAPSTPTAATGSPAPSSVASGTPLRDGSPLAAPPSPLEVESSSEAEAEDPSSNEAVAELFETGNFGTLEEHVKAHNFPMHVRTCGPCKFWKNRWKWSVQASFANTVTGQRETWLMCVGGFAACKVCRQYGGQYGGSARKRHDVALGRGSFAKFQNILRHGNATAAQQKKLATFFGPQPGINWDHEMAVQQWCREKSSALVPDSGAVVTESVARDRRSAFINLRTLLETQGSFSSLEKWVAAAQVEKPGIQKHNDVFKQCLQTIVSYERFITKTLLERGSVFRLQADARKRVYQVQIGAVLWKFPAALRTRACRLGKEWLYQLLRCSGALGRRAADRNA